MPRATYEDAPLDEQRNIDIIVLIHSGNNFKTEFLN